MFVKSCSYVEKELGALVHVSVRSNARSMRARLVGTEYRVSVPQGTTVGDFEKFIAQIKERLTAASEAAVRCRFEPGMVLEGLMMRVEITDGDVLKPDEIVAKRSKASDGTLVLRFVVSAVGDPIRYQRYVNSRILTDACGVAEEYFTPLVLEAAEKVGIRRRVASVNYNTNRSNYGICYRDGRLKFSSRLIFYPQELRELVIMHELAHITYPNHSPRFHALVDKYLGGREHALEKALREYRSPLF